MRCSSGPKTSAKKTCVPGSCDEQKISDAMTFFRQTCARCLHVFCSSASEHLHSCVRRVRTATSFCHLLLWTSWLQPWESSG